MNSKIKALFAVAIMVAAAFMIVVPMDKDDGSEAAVWDSEAKTIKFVKDNYAFSYKVVLPLNTAVFTAEASNPATALATIVIDNGSRINVTVENEGNKTGTEVFTSGSTITATVGVEDANINSDAGSIKLTSYYLSPDGLYRLATGGSEKTIKFDRVSGGSYFDDDEAVITAAEGETPAVTGIVTSGVVKTEFKKVVGSSSGVTYSAKNLPKGLTMMSNGTIYGAPQGTFNDNGDLKPEAIATLYAYDPSLGYVQSCNFKFNTMSIDDVIIGPDNVYVYSTDNVVYKVKNPYVFDGSGEDVNPVKYQISNDGVSSNVGVGSGEDAGYSLLTLGLTDVRGQVTVVFGIDVGGNVFQVSKTFFVMPVSEFLTDPNADMMIELA